MLNQLSQQLLSRLLGLSALGLLLTTGLATSAATPTLASGLETSASNSQKPAVASKLGVFAQVPASNGPMPDGVYLYGESSQPEQIGKEYLVFEARRGKIIGAFYMPSSAFNCFYGTLESKQLNLTVVNWQDNTTHSHSVALEQTVQVASSGRLMSPNSVTLEGYHRINTVSQNDRQLLSTCKANSQR